MKAIAGKTIVSLRERPSSRLTLDDELLYGMVVEVLEETADAEEGDECNVVVIYESIPVQYDADGNALAPQAADWSVPLVSGSTEGGND